MRTVILVRHGQYNAGSGSLTPLGRRQAAATARALHGIKLSAIHASTLPRALETAAVLKAQLKSRHKVRASALLREAVPTRLPGRTTPERQRQVRENLRRMKRAYAKFVRPARGERTELVVAHGNLIRLFVCLALRATPATWLKMRSNNCGITILEVGDARGETLVSYNDVGHLAGKLRTLM